MSSNIFKLILFSCILSFGKSEEGNIVNQEVYSTVDLRDQLATVSSIILFENKGFPTRIYNYITEDSDLHSISFFNIQGEPLKFKQTPLNGTNLLSYEVSLDTIVWRKRTYKLFVKTVYANKIVPVLEGRKIEEDQLMKYENNGRFLSLYHTVVTKFEYLVKNDSVVEVSEKPTYETSQNITYLFYNTPKLSFSLMTVVFINNDAFLQIKSLRRRIDVNHFGKIIIEDHVDIQNTGAKLTGPYNPVSSKKKASVSWLYTHLPASAENIEFFDNLGNNSESQIYHYINYITLKFKSRYPLLGGWKTSYILRYGVPLHEYLFVNGTFFSLEIRAIDYVIQNKPIKDALIVIALPEGAQLKKVYKPAFLNITKQEVDYYGNLNVFGRPLVILKGKDLFENYIQAIIIEYFFNSWYLLRVPFLVCVYLETVFLILIFGKKIC